MQNGRSKYNHAKVRCILKIWQFYTLIINQYIRTIFFSSFKFEYKITFQLLHTDTPITLPVNQTQSSWIQGRLPDKDRPMENASHRISVPTCLLQFLRNNLSQNIVLS